MRSKHDVSYLMFALLLSASSPMNSSATAGPAPNEIAESARVATDVCDDQQQLDAQTIDAYERLDKWKRCVSDGSPGVAELPQRLVYKHNRSRAAGTGFPTRLAVGKKAGLTDHETAAIFGWTTGDYRLLNPIARGQDAVEFDEYPFLPTKLTKVKCKLTREEVMPYVHVLSTALSKMPALSSQKMRLWRGHRRLIRPSKVGSIIAMRGFTSVTRDREKALEFATKSNEGRSSKRTLVGILEHSNARALSKISARSDEVELLFPLETTFEVVDPPEEASDDLRAVQRAAESMRADQPDAEIELVYVREVNLKAGGQSCPSPPIGSWE